MALSKIRNDSLEDTAVHGRRNLIINGAMQVFQRATAATAAAGGYETADRFIMGEVSGGAYTTERSTDHPTSSGYSLKAQVTTADTSLSAAHYAYIFHKIEAQNLQHLAYGTSSAKTLTLSFFVKSNKTGTYTVNLYKPDGTGYIFVQEYTIDSADTWEKKTITISPTAGSTSFITASAGAIANDNGSGLEVGFGLAWGSNYTGGTSGSWSSNTNHYATTNQVNWLDSTSNNFYLTQIQIEVGEQATPFEHHSFADELRRCQRYHYRRDITIYDVAAMGGVSSTNRGAYLLNIPTAMRAKPSCSQGSNIYCWYSAGGSVTTQSNLVVVYMDNDATEFNQVYIMADANSTLASVGHPLALTSYHSSGTADTHVSLDAEL